MTDRATKIRSSKQFHNGRFRNTHPMRPMQSAPSPALLREFFFGGKKRVPQSRLPVESPLLPWQSRPSTGLRVTWLGHSTLLFEIDGARILTDPVFSDYAAPFALPGRKRFHPVPAKIEELPKLDAIIQSHDHYDHLSRSSWRKIARSGRVPVVTSLRVGERLEAFGVDRSLITELDWWESHTIPGTDVTITATPAQHFSGRGLTDRNRTLWSSWVIAGSKRIFFSADTGLTDELEEIGKRFGPFDLTLLEIGASNPAWADIHLGPVNAMRAFEMLGGGTLLPIHWATFDLALHPWKEPIETLLSLNRPPASRILTPPPGRPIEPSLVQSPTLWWQGIE